MNEHKNLSRESVGNNIGMVSNAIERDKMNCNITCYALGCGRYWY